MVLQNAMFSWQFWLILYFENQKKKEIIQSYHYWEDDGEERRLENPEDSKTDNLDEGEQMDASQGDVSQEGEVWLMFRRHQVQLDPLPELEHENPEYVLSLSQCLFVVSHILRQ